MWIEPNKERLKKLNVDGFENGQFCLFCPECSWQTFEEFVVPPKCQECRIGLHITKVDDELRQLIDSYNRKEDTT